MSNVNFEWDFTLTDGTTQKVSSTIDGIIFSGDDISECLVNITGQQSGNRFSEEVTLPFLINKIFEDNNITASAGSLITSMASNIKTILSSYSSTDVSTITNAQFVEVVSNSIINVTTGSSPATDVFDVYPGKYTFVASGTNAANTFAIKIPQFQSDGTTVNTTYTLSTGDSLSIYGQKIGTTFGYFVISKQIATLNGSILVTGDLSASGNSMTLNIPDIGVKFVFTGTGSGIYNCIVYPIGTSSINNLDLRRSTIWNGGSVETYTINDGTLTTAGTNIDSSVYSNSQDVSVVLVCVNSIVWEVKYWASATAVRSRAVATRAFV